MGHAPTNDLRIVLLQHDLAWEDKPANRSAFASLLAESAQPGSLVILPELCDVGFTMQADRAAEPSSLPWAQDLAARHQVWLQAGLAIREAGRTFNAACMIGPDGSLLATYRKTFLFSHGTETEHYAAGSGPIVVEIAGWRVAPFICYDLRFPEVWRHAALAGAELFTLSANWPARRHAHWAALVRARAIENQAFVACCNRVGRDPNLAYDGGSALIDPMGEALVVGDGRACALDAVARRSTIELWRRDFGALRDMQPGWLGSDRRHT
ncbi:MAG: carbon-nitrogen family hydrolase [Planctomycetes bacterium]|nr:carbon-nitrogen family hydrolase [Planctomycetota bacterium]